MAQRKFIERLFADHAAALQVFFRKRIRAQRDAPDLAQETYLRMLRTAQTSSIANPEAYLFTVANNLVKERHVIEFRQSRRVELTDPAVLGALEAEAVELDVETQVDRQRHLKILRAVLPELAPRSRLAIFLAFEEGLSHQEIAQRLGVSKTMVHKILTQAIAHCRKRMLCKEVP
jgi:RNA polymerase sigma factor (sigma-70 family)